MRRRAEEGGREGVRLRIEWDDEEGKNWCYAKFTIVSGWTGAIMEWDRMGKNWRGGNRGDHLSPFHPLFVIFFSFLPCNCPFYQMKHHSCLTDRNQELSHLMCLILDHPSFSSTLNFLLFIMFCCKETKKVWRVVSVIRWRKVWKMRQILRIFHPSSLDTWGDWGELDEEISVRKERKCK